jgi:glutathione S-transferase
VGDRFSRADVTAASLLAPLALPAEHPTYEVIVLPPGVAADRDAWLSRPIVSWVREIYRKHR